MFAFSELFIKKVSGTFYLMFGPKINHFGNGTTLYFDISSLSLGINYIRVGYKYQRMREYVAIINFKER